MFTYFRPEPRLQELVGASYLVQADVPVFVDRLPALMAQLQIVLQGSLTYTFPDGRRVQSPPAALIGPCNGAVTVEGAGPGLLLGVALLPRGWASLVGCPAGECADLMLDATDVWGASCVAELMEQAQAAKGPMERAATVSRFLERMLMRKAWRADARIGVIDRWIASAPNIDVDALSHELELSGRQVGRLTTLTHGCSPKLLQMKYKSLQAAALLAVENRTGWGDAAGDAFYDQSHLIRHFNRFVGLTPHAFVQGRQAMARATILGRWKAGIRAPIALWS